MHNTLILPLQLTWSSIKMRLIKQNIIEKDGSGSATLLPEEPEDMVSQSVSNARYSWCRCLQSPSGTATT